MVAFDLQCHSTYSDGALPPAEVMAEAARHGVELVALTDHDTVDGIGEALEAATALGIRLSPAIEISVVGEAHLLGYEIDHTDAGLLQALVDWRADRTRRVLAMADRLEELGLTLDRSTIDERHHQGLSIGRPHVADAVRDDIDRDELFRTYLSPGGKAFVPRTRPTAEEAIAVIHDAGGVAIHAHPGGGPPLQGVDGIEVFHPSHTEDQTRALHAQATRSRLLITGATDMHRPEDGFLRFETYGLEPALGPIGTRSARV